MKAVYFQTPDKNLYKAFNELNFKTEVMIPKPKFIMKKHRYLKFDDMGNGLISIRKRYPDKLYNIYLNNKGGK